MSKKRIDGETVELIEVHQLDYDYCGIAQYGEGNCTATAGAPLQVVQYGGDTFNPPSIFTSVLNFTGNHHIIIDVKAAAQVTVGDGGGIVYSETTGPLNVPEYSIQFGAGAFTGGGVDAGGNQQIQWENVCDVSISGALLETFQTWEFIYTLSTNSYEIKLDGISKSSGVASGACVPYTACIWGVIGNGTSTNYRPMLNYELNNLKITSLGSEVKNILFNGNSIDSVTETEGINNNVTYIALAGNPDLKCFHTLKTCQDTPNFDQTTKTLTLSKPQSATLKEQREIVEPYYAEFNGVDSQVSTVPFIVNDDRLYELEIQVYDSRGGNKVFIYRGERV